MLALAQLLGLHVHQMDVDTAFLYAKLKEEIYMYPPEGMEGIPEGKVLKLMKSLYGLKQSPMNFNNIPSTSLLSPWDSSAVYQITVSMSD
jgi:hypothetical protein